jgi:glutamate N-acetyltransferase/amino-acid N-acetyltransferase
MRTSSELLPAGFRFSGSTVGIKASGRPDLAVVLTDRPCVAAGVYTTNRVAAAPVGWCRGVTPSSAIRAVVINSGNANAATGPQGEADVRATAEAAARLVSDSCHPHQILIASTGVIGRTLPMDRLLARLPEAFRTVAATPEALQNAAVAMMTTDTKPKTTLIQREVAPGRTVRLVGIAKGAAMIAPRMATMLGVLMMDAAIEPTTLQALLKNAVDDTFNCLTVEGHTSTNDTVFALALDSSGEPALEGEAVTVGLAGVIRDACEDLANQIADDAEGATHRVFVEVVGCVDRASAAAIARAIAESPLVKTAIHGHDPNWGRIVSAAGYAGVPFEPTDLSLTLNGFELYRAGVPTAFDAQAVSQSMAATRDVRIRLSLGDGPAGVTFRTCDLTAEYVRLNADYTT